MRFSLDVNRRVDDLLTHINNTNEPLKEALLKEFTRYDKMIADADERASSFENAAKVYKAAMEEAQADKILFRDIIKILKENY